MSRKCTICNKKIGFFDVFYEQKYCYNCYKKEEQRRIQEQQLLEQQKLNSLKEYLSSSLSCLSKAYIITSTLPDTSLLCEPYKALIDFIKIMYSKLESNFTLDDLNKLTNINFTNSQLFEETNYLFDYKFNNTLFNYYVYSSNSIDYIVGYSTLDELFAIIDHNFDNIGNISYENVYSADEINNLHAYVIQMPYYQACLNIMYLVLYSREIEKFLSHSELSQIIINLENKVYNRDYLIEKVYDLYFNLYRQEFSIEFSKEDIEDILSWFVRYKRIKKDASNNISVDSIEDYVFDIDISKLIQFDDKKGLLNLIQAQILDNIMDCKDYLSLDKLLYILSLVDNKAKEILSTANKKKAELEKERILNGDFNIEKNVFEQSIDYSNLSNGYQFENFVANLYKLLGYEILDVTSKSGDQGADVLAEKDNLKYAIQAKYYSGRVGNKAIQEIVAAKAFYNADIAVVVTNSLFTKSAIELAKSNNVLLVDEPVLRQMISTVKETI